MGKKVSPQNDKFGTYYLHCPGCECTHIIWTKFRGGRPGWTFNEDLENPTFHPSLLVTSGNKKGKSICHSFVKDGKIQFLSDSTHHLKGQTVEIPDWNPQ